MKTSLTRISLHIICIFRRPSRWRFFAAGIARELDQWIPMAIEFGIALVRKNSAGPESQTLRFSQQPL